ncbi:MAG: molybdopterin-dependent oxidoreductase [Solirubrobacteraceae bacterium]
MAAALVAAGREARLLLTVPECNSLGLALLGGQPLSEALQALRDGRAATAVVLENDLYRRADRATVDAALDRCRHLVVLDHALHATAERAELVLPAATFAEASGTLVNNEARAQRFFQLLFPDDAVATSWRWLNDAACDSGRANQRWASLDQVIAALGAELPALAAVAGAAPAGTYRIAGSRIASAPHRESGRTAMYADRTVHEPPPPVSLDSPYNHSMEGYYGQMPAAIYPFFWTPDWNSEQGLNRFQQEVGGPLRGGEAGVHLIAPATASAASDGAAALAEARIPAAFQARPGRWLLLPAYRVFGSEELSARAPAVRERIAQASLGLHPADAAELGVGADDPVQLVLEHARYSLPAELRPALPRGVATLTIGLAGTPWLALPLWAELSKAAA